jgi:hypothetical protein
MAGKAFCNCRNSVEEGFWAFEQWQRVSSTRHRYWRRVGSRAAVKTNWEIRGL